MDIFTVFKEIKELRGEVSREEMSVAQRVRLDILDELKSRLEAKEIQYLEAMETEYKRFEFENL